MAKILVVDDDQTVQDLFQRVLKNEGHEVLAASTGEECLEVLGQKDKCDLDMIFLDLRMPGIGGEETLEHIRKNYGNIPVCFISGYGTIPEKIRLFKKPFVRYIRKPFDVDYIKAMVANRDNRT